MKPRVVVTLSTLPGRYEKLYQTLKSINSQETKPDEVYLTVAKRAKRLNIEYPPFPEKILALCKVVVLEEDYGPITKILGGIYEETEDETVIISIDDDTIYPNNMITRMLKKSKMYPNSAICASGIIIGYGGPLMGNVVNIAKKTDFLVGFPLTEEGRAVDIVYGFSGVLYKRKFFPKKEKIYEEIIQYALKDKDVFINDDVMISCFLSKNKIERRVFEFDSINQLTEDRDGNEISYNLTLFMKRFFSSLNKTAEWGFWQNYENVEINETIFGRAIGLILLFLLLAFLVYICYKHPFSLIK